MCRALFMAALLLAGCRDGHRAAGSRHQPAVPPFEVTVLADHLERPAGIALDATHVYFPTRDHGVFRVARAGGKPEAQPASGWVAPPWSSVHRGIAMTVIKRAGSPDPQDEAPGPSDQRHHYTVNTSFVLRRPLGGGAFDDQILARSFTNDVWSKPLVIDDTRVYWLEPPAGALLAMPKAGGPVTLLCEALPPRDYDLAAHGDRLYLLDVDGELSSVPVTGGARQIHGTLPLANDRHGVWMAAAPEGLYVVSDALGYPRGPGPTFAGRVLRVAYPPAGRPAVAQPFDLYFASTIEIDAGGVPKPADLDRLDTALASLFGPLSAGHIPVTVGVTGASSDAQVAAVEAWLRAHFGPAVRIERVRRPDPSPAAGPGTLRVGIEGKYVPALFAVP